MIVDKEILRQYGLFDRLPENFKNLTDKQYYVFFYTMNEDELKLIVHEELVTEYMNPTLYRGQKETRDKYKIIDIRIGYLRNTNESRDGIFYLFLRTWYSQNEVQPFYDYCKSVDEQINLSLATDFNTDVVTSDDFKKNIGYFCKGKLQAIMLVYDMVDAAFKRRLSKPLYGGFLTRVVKMVKFSGGILPEVGGTFRYMVIGEKAVLSDTQRANLKLAKDYLRSDVKPIDIYTKTGWGFSESDGLWRTNISDANFSISDRYLFENDGHNLYVPPGFSRQMTLNLVANPENIYALRYNGRLSDVLVHEKLFNHYPRLANLPLLYYVGENMRLGNEFYYSPSSKGGYIKIQGNNSWGYVNSILLHEIQHAIQRIEGFAQGGNTFLAQFVVSLGAESVRKVFACINILEGQFEKTFDTEAKRLELYSVLKAYTPKSNDSVDLHKELLRYVGNPISFESSKKNINFYLVLLIGADNDIANNEIVDFLADNYIEQQALFYEIMQNIVDGQAAASKYREILRTRGYGSEDIQNVQFSNYERLYGEIESRSVQHSRALDGELKNYFTMTSWEREPIELVTVIDGRVEILDVEKIKGAVETKDDKYVMHFLRSLDCIPFLHELGHIVHDGLRKLGHDDVINAEYNKTYQFSDVEEFFVAKFLTYLRERIDDETLQNDFRQAVYSESNAVINKILDDFFIDDEVDIRLRFLQELLKLVAI